MHKITRNRAKSFYNNYFKNDSIEIINLVDVGSGGELKEPWKNLPNDSLVVYDFEPLEKNLNNNELPLCISNTKGVFNFYIAEDERGSSLHKVSDLFLNRFGMVDMKVKKIIKVNTITLDEHLNGKYDQVDALDINTEGHDYFVLEGANSLLDSGKCILIKIEFQLTSVYENQKYFSDIDILLRKKGYILADLQIDNVKAYRFNNKGEPITGKAIYCYGRELLEKRFQLHSKLTAIKIFNKILQIYLASELPGHCKDLLDSALKFNIIDSNQYNNLLKDLKHIFYWSEIEFSYNLFKKYMKRFINKFNPF